MRRLVRWAPAALVLALGACAAGAPRPPADESTLTREAPAPEGLAVPKGPISEDPCAIPLATAPEGLLEPGAVSRIQQALVRAGSLTGAHAEGRLDPPTLKALRAFQRAHDLPPTGLPDDATLSALGLDPGALYVARDASKCGGRG